MEITTDVQLKGTTWGKIIDGYSSIFTNRTNYALYLLCMSIGIMYDKRIEKPEENGENPRNVPRNVLQNNDNGKLDFIFQAAILSTQTESFTEDERLDLAFGEKSDFNKLAFLTQFANFGATKMEDLLGTSDIETMENLNRFICSSVEGRNLDIDALPDDILLEDD